MKKLLIFILGIFPIFYAGGIDLTLSPGELGNELAKLTAQSGETTLVLKGTASASDLISLRSLPATVKSVDMSGLTIKGISLGSSSWFGQRKFDDWEIPAYVFLGKGVEKVVLPADTRKIGNGAFASSSISEISAPKVQELGEAVFFGCQDLKSVDMLGSAITEIPDYAFAECGNLTGLRLPGDIERIGSHAFEKSGVVSLSMPRCAELGEYAFAFAGKLKGINVKSGCKMGEGVFYGAQSLENAPYDEGNTPALYLNGAGSQKIIYARSSEIGEGAYSGAPAEIIGVSAGVDHIGAYSFSDMANLKSVDVSGREDVPAVEETSFAGKDPGDVILYVAKGTRGMWEAAPVWRDFTISEEPSIVTELEKVVKDGIYVYTSGGMIYVVAQDGISSVSIYSLDGRSLGNHSGDGESGGEYRLAVAYPDGESAVVVKVESGGIDKIVKLIR